MPVLDRLTITPESDAIKVYYHYVSDTPASTSERLLHHEKTCISRPLCNLNLSLITTMTGSSQSTLIANLSIHKMLTFNLTQTSINFFVLNFLYLLAY